MKRAERLHAIGIRLRRAQPSTVPAADLAREFGVTRRTIERDLESLRAAGVPIFGQPGRTGGVGSIERPGRRVVALDDAQIVGLLVALHGSGGSPFAGAARTAVAELTEALGPVQREAATVLADRVRVARLDSPAEQRIRSVLEDAVRDQVVVNLTYVDRNGDTTRRSVDPVAFFGADGRWSLIGWCHLRKAGRLFRLERVQRATVTRRPAAQHDVDAALGWVPHEVDTIEP